ncbi:MAG: Fe-S protein assembly co-chaperone HscB [Gammaproteobacteria bacterium]|nr:Fe-S protein assembly co-chaperone HscB [Gammaproteobacteria bacterium]MDX5375889.1 Fe-S protein assembly co-chaperone HscB [Gammaproteobacteria bacterium]
MNIDFSQNHFALFGLPVGFEVDAAALADSYRSLQAQLHPDRFATADDKQRRLSVQGASWVNEAYQTLKDPMRRARYLLELEGVSFNDETETSSDPEFLMEQMALREALGEVREAADPMAALDTVGDRIQALDRALTAEFERAHAAGDLAAAKEAVLKMKFFRRLREEVERLEAELEDELT